MNSMDFVWPATLRVFNTPESMLIWAGILLVMLVAVFGLLFVSYVVEENVVAPLNRPVGKLARLAMGAALAYALIVYVFPIGGVNIPLVESINGILGFLGLGAI